MFVTMHPFAGAVRRKGGGGGWGRTNPTFGGQPSRPQLGNSTRGAAGHLGLTCLAVDQVLHIGAPGRKWVDKPTGSGCGCHGEAYARLVELDRILAVASGQGLGIADAGGEAAADHVIAKLKTQLAWHRQS